MGPVTRAVARTAADASDRPGTLVVAVGTGLAAPGLAVLSGRIDPIGWVAYAFLVQPLLLAGLLYVNTSHADQPITYTTYGAGIRSNAFALFRAFVVVAAIFTVLGALAAAALFLVGFTGVIGLTPALGLVIVVIAVAGIGLQFVDAAVVVDGTGAIGSMLRSVGMVTDNPLSVLGYAVVRVSALLALVWSAATVAAVESLAEVGLLAAGVVFATVGYFLGGPIHAAVYEEIQGSGGRN